MQAQIHVNETCTVALQAVDEFGNIVTDATLTNTSFSNSDDTVLTSTPSADGNSDLIDPNTTAAGKSSTLSISTQIGTAIFTSDVEFDVVAGPVAGINPVLTFSPRTPTPAPGPAALKA